MSELYRYKTSAPKDLFHIVPAILMKEVQAVYLASKGINRAFTVRTFKTLKEAEDAVKPGFVIVWEKAM